MSADFESDLVYQLILITLKYPIRAGKLNSLPPQLQMENFITSIHINHICDTCQSQEGTWDKKMNFNID